MLEACLLLCAFAGVLSSVPAWADIYRWTNKKGELVYSNVLPSGAETVKGLVLVTKATTTPVQPAAGPTQQELLARVKNLELQLQAQAAVPAPIVMPAHVSPPAYYQPPAPPVVPYYDTGWAGGYDNSYLLPFASSLLPLTVVTVTPLHRRWPFGGRSLIRGGIHDRGYFPALGGRGGHRAPGGGGSHRGR